MKASRSQSTLFVIPLFLVIAMQTGTAFATSAIYKPLQVPKAEDVVAFSNGAFEGAERKLATREQILKFLSSGTNNEKPETWYALQNSDDSWDTLECDGVFTDKAGKVYFWQLNNLKTLTLLTADGEQALIQLGK